MKMLVVVTENEDNVDLVVEVVKTMATLIEQRQLVIVSRPKTMVNAATSVVKDNVRDQELLMEYLKKEVQLAADVVALVVHALKAEVVEITKAEMVSAKAEAVTKEMVNAEAEVATAETVRVQAEEVTKEMVSVEAEVVITAVKAATRALLAITIDKATPNLVADVAAHVVAQEVANKPLISELLIFQAQIN